MRRDCPAASSKGPFSTSKVFLDGATFPVAKSARMDGLKALSKYVAENGQAQTAREVGCSDSHLHLVLAGERNLSVAMAKKVSRATGIPASDLLGLEAAE
jgi:antitoxin component HigA of HigAB toxin-antitoxin module